MRCSLMKWMISGSLDSGKDFPAVVKRHLASCPDCRDFAAISDEIGMVLTRDAGKVVRPDLMFARKGTTNQYRVFGRVCFAGAVAACLLIAITATVFRSPQEQSVDDITSVAEELAQNYNPTPVLEAQIDGFQGEITAVEQDIEEMTELLLASTHLVSDETISNILF